MRTKAFTERAKLLLIRRYKTSILSKVNGVYHTQIKVLATRWEADVGLMTEDTWSTVVGSIPNLSLRFAHRVSQWFAEFMTRMFSSFILW